MGTKLLTQQERSCPTPPGWEEARGQMGVWEGERGRGGRRGRDMERAGGDDNRIK